MSQENTLRMALTALESCSGAPHWDSLQPTVTAIKKALVALTQTSSDKDLTQQDFDRDCDAPPEPWSAIWIAWNSEDGFTFWATEKQAALWSATDSNEWPVQYAMQKAQPTVPLTDDQIRALTPKPDGVAEGNVRRVEVLPGVMGTEFDEVDAWSMPLVLQIARAIEAAHGITEKGKP
jgi:hypothetical protein